MRKALARNHRMEALDDLFVDNGRIAYALLWLISFPLPLVALFYFVLN